MAAAKKLQPSRRVILPSLDEVEDFVAQFESALIRGALDTHLPDLIAVLDDRVRWYTATDPSEHDPLVASFLHRVERLRAGPPALTVGECYTVLGSRYEGVVVRYMGPYQDGANAPLIEVMVVTPTVSSGLNMKTLYRIPRTAIDQSTEDPE